MRLSPRVLLFAFAGLIVAAYLYVSNLQPYDDGAVRIRHVLHTLESWIPHPDNRLESVKVLRNEYGPARVEVKYFYSGVPFGARIRVRTDDATPAYATLDLQSAPLHWGTDYTVLTLKRPDSDPHGTLVSRKIIVDLVYPERPYSGPSTTLDEIVEWSPKGTKVFTPTNLDSEERRKEFLAEVTRLIDDDRRASHAWARSTLEALLLADPKLVQAHVELARLAIRQEGYPAGFLEAENRLTVALGIDSKHHNAKILMGHVHTYLGKYESARRLFEEVAEDPNDNLWLWTNWAELEKREGNHEAAIERYLQTVAPPRPHSSSDRAMRVAYDRALPLLIEGGRIEKALEIQQKRMSEFPNEPEHLATLARLKLLSGALPDVALQLARKAKDSGCDANECSHSLGIALYAKWHADGAGADNPVYHQAGGLFPPSADLFLALAEADATTGIISSLVSQGHEVDDRDGDAMTALARALERGQIGVAERLMAAGARLQVKVGYAEMPLPLVPIFSNQKKSVELLIRHGIDYSTLRFHDLRAKDLAMQAGHQEIADLISASTSL